MNENLPDPGLVSLYKRFAPEHRSAIRRRVARMIIGGSITRPLRADSSVTITATLNAIDLDVLPNIQSEDDYQTWFRQQVDKLKPVIDVRAGLHADKYLSNNWGHTAKIMCLYLEEIVLRVALLHR